MPRNMNLIKLILTEIEKAETSWKPVNINIDGYSNEVIDYHCKLMFEAGLIQILGNKPVNNYGTIIHYLPTCLTWEGHEFLEASKNSKIWNKAIDTIKDKGLGMSFDILKGILLQEGLKLAGLK